MKANTLRAAMAGFGRLLPGDVIHDEAPLSRGNPTARMAAIDAAQRKRMRKLDKRRGNAL